MTVTLDRDIERMLRETAARTHRPFKNVLNDTLRLGIQQSLGTTAEEPFVLNARSMGLRTGHDPVGFNKLGDDLEAEAFLHATQSLK
jgi:hypothetical protein